MEKEEEYKLTKEDIDNLSSPSIKSQLISILKNKIEKASMEELEETLLYLEKQDQKLGEWAEHILGINESPRLTKKGIKQGDNL